MNQNREERDKLKLRIKELEAAYDAMHAQAFKAERVVEAARVLDKRLSFDLDDCWNGDAEDCDASCEPCAIRYFRAALADYDEEA